jgi:flagellar biosynthesis/type III secretory pathway protein FliH
VAASFDHEILVEMFRNRGELAPELLRTCARIALDHERVEVTSIDLSQVSSTEYRADAVIELRDQANAVVAAVIVEVQLDRDPDKKYTWPAYVSVLRAKLQRGVTLLVLTAAPGVTRWARKAIDLGHPGFCLEPIVIELGDLPRSIDHALAQKLPELAVLSAMGHPDLATAKTAVEAIATLPQDQKQLYLDVILARLPDPVRQELESLMLQGYKYQSEYALRYYNQGLEQGLNQGLEQGLNQGLEQGLNQGLEQGLNQGLEQGLNQGLEQGLNQGREEGLRAGALVLARVRLAETTADDEAALAALDERALTDLITALGSPGDRAQARDAFNEVIRKHRGA